MSSTDQTRLLQMRSTILHQNNALQRAAGHGAATAELSFTEAMGQALATVNGQQQRATALTEAYQRGDSHDLVQVMVERQKAAIGFETTLQVRNKLLSAYRDIMNMPV
jgi:flagellar hook-basal body complex protein FliE